MCSCTVLLNPLLDCTAQEHQQRITAWCCADGYPANCWASGCCNPPLLFRLTGELCRHYIPQGCCVPTLFPCMPRSCCALSSGQINRPITTVCLTCREDAHVLFARLLSGYGRDASLNAKERRAPGTVSITQLPGSPNASRSSAIGSEAVDGRRFYSQLSWHVQELPRCCG
jgi:hypothetical protein